MKKLILVLVALVAQTAMAEQVKQEVISVEQFKKETQKHLDNVFQEGELENIGGTCTVGLVEQNGKLVVELTGEGFDFNVPVDLGKTVSVKRDYDLDGSGTLIYKFGQTRELKLIHADDAYDSASLKMGGTQLTCTISY